MVGIYSIVNVINGKRYIGQTVNFPRRKTQHKTRLKNGGSYMSYSKLYPAYLKYGFDSLKFEWIETCSKDQLNEREMHWINYFDSYRNGYNATIGGQNPIAYWTGKKRSIKTIEKVSRSLTGKKLSLHTRRKMSKAHSGRPKKYLQGRYRAVVCVETGERFNSVLEAAQAVGCSQSLMHRHLKGGCNHTKGYRFNYYDQIKKTRE